tara:strand:- start:1027 stop:1626 length:600 start_codon:yes stop_codon:yes gene_type:complete
MNILEYIESLENPIVFDTDNKFLFFPINKNAQTSICRNTLKHRCVLRKDSLDKWVGYQKNLTEESIYEYFKFAIVRNPYDRFVSAYFYLLQNDGTFPKHDSIDSFIKNYFPLGDFYDVHFQKQTPQLYYNDKLIVDYLGRLETINTDWEIISQKIDCPSNMVHRNISKHKNYTDELSIEHREIIYNYYKEDFTKLGYDK